MNKDECPVSIWLIDSGDDYLVWCDCPDPSDDIDPSDTLEYVRINEVEKLRKRIKALEAIVHDIGAHRAELLHRLGTK